MRILLMTPHRQAEVVTTEILPRIGDQVDRFYRPCPTVKNVVLWPSKESLQGLTVEGQINALVLVE